MRQSPDRSTLLQSLTILPLIAQVTSHPHHRHLRNLEDEEIMPEADSQTKIIIVVSVTCVVLVGLLLFARYFIFRSVGVEQEDDEKSIKTRLEAANKKAKEEREKYASDTTNENESTRRVRFAEP